jgi:hypothetical protein
MSITNPEDLFWQKAVEELWQQYKQHNPGTKRSEYLSEWSAPKFYRVDGGQQLTLAKKVEGTYVPDERYTPVNCYNQIQPTETLAEAVRRASSGR